MRRYSLEEKSKLLRNHFLLKTLSDEDLEKLARYSQVQEVEPGTVIFSKSDAGDSMMVIIAGKVVIGSTSVAGKELVLNIIGEGEVLGEIAFIDGEARTADARALEETVYLVLERRYFQPLLDEQPKLASELLGVLCQRLRNTTDQMEDTAFYELKTRLARKLMAFAQHYGEASNELDNVELPVNQSELGAMLSATRESVNRQLRELANAGLIELNQGAITILDRDGLDDQAQEYS
ncbi:MAG: Crp/Fnr family transcriptional regulator [Alphaproteobacteria bacterium]|nr:Crp/Fnr family transcriptional regulator [Alphaproteobacteria bacterium]